MFDLNGDSTMISDHGEQDVWKVYITKLTVLEPKRRLLTRAAVNLHGIVLLMPDLPPSVLRNEHRSPRSALVKPGPSWGRRVTMTDLGMIDSTDATVR